jgi:hypothetical protein
MKLVTQYGFKNCTISVVFYQKDLDLLKNLIGKDREFKNHTEYFTKLMYKDFDERKIDYE